MLLKFRLSLSFAVSDLCAFYKRNILDPAGSLMSAIYLQGNKNSIYPTLDPATTRYCSGFFDVRTSDSPTHHR